MRTMLTVGAVDWILLQMGGHYMCYGVVLVACDRLIHAYIRAHQSVRSMPKRSDYECILSSFLGAADHSQLLTEFV